MTLIRLIGKSYLHYFKNNVLVSLGIAICTMVITGALIIGDSVRYSLEKIVDYRLGGISQTITAGDWLFTSELSQRISKKTDIPLSSALKLDGMASVNGGKFKINNIQVFGVDEKFGSIIGSVIFDSIRNAEAIISENFAKRLHLKIDDIFLLRIKKAGVIPSNTPFVSDNEQTISQRVKVKAIASRENFGQFNLQATQNEPFNVFVNIKWLNKVSKINGKANIIFIPENNDHLANTMAEVWQPEDINLKIKFVPSYNEWKITSERMFIDNQISNSILKAFPEAKPILTYFVNSISSDNGIETPYSFVAAVRDSLIHKGSIIINDWVAKDLNVNAGDSVKLKYFVIGPLKELFEKEKSFIVKKVVPIKGKYADAGFMPDIPGLSDAGNCREWETDVPVKLEKIRDKDEDYWNNFKGTPKAFISLDEGQTLWQNRFGNITSIRINADNVDESQIIEFLKSKIQLPNLGFKISKVKKNGIVAARNGVDFGQLFLGLSFFIMLSGIILTSLLIVFNLEQRKAQIGTFSAIGYSSQLIRWIFIFEGMLTSVAGIFAGIILSVIYNKLIIIGLDKAWQEIVRTNEIEIIIKPSTLLVGFSIGIIVALGSHLIVIKGYATQSITKLQKKNTSEQKSKTIKAKKILAIILMAFIIILIFLQLFLFKTINPTIFFISGTLLLVVFYLGTNLFLIHLDQKIYKKLNLNLLGIKNLVRNRTGSQVIILILAVGTFAVVSTGANRKDIYSDACKKTSGTGGFEFIAETTVPILKDLNNQEVSSEFGIPDSLNFLQFRVQEGDDASCLNLNRISSPRILGVNPRDLEGRFSFVSKTSQLDEINPWKSLGIKIGDAIPAIADETVIKWGLGKKVGDTLTYMNNMGVTTNIILIGGLANSIFQGNVIISDSFFIQNFSFSSGLKLFLIDYEASDTSQIKKELNFIFRDYGWEMESTTEKLAVFSSVENTYLQIFLILGSFGLLLGTIGLIIIMAKSINDRRSEIALLLATGYSFNTVIRIFFTEYSLLLIIGITGGTIAAILSVIPVFISGFNDVSLYYLLFIFAIIIFNGLIWIGLIGWIMVKRLKIIEALRNE